MDDEIISVLTEALNGYLKILNLEHHLSELSQPRQGKSAESNIDILRREYYQSRTSTTQACLRFAPWIAYNVRKWRDSIDDTKGESEPFEIRYPASINDVTTWEQDKKPYLNPFTGKLVEPEGSQFAGSSNTKYSSSRDERVGNKESPAENAFPAQTKVPLPKSPSSSSAANPRRETDNLDKKSTQNGSGKQPTHSQDGKSEPGQALESSIANTPSKTRRRPKWLSPDEIQEFVKLSEKNHNTPKSTDIGIAITTSDIHARSKAATKEARSATSLEHSPHFDSLSHPFRALDFDVEKDRQTALDLQAKWAVENDVFTEVKPPLNSSPLLNSGELATKTSIQKTNIPRRQPVLVIQTDGLSQQQTPFSTSNGRKMVAEGHITTNKVGPSPLDGERTARIKRNIADSQAIYRRWEQEANELRDQNERLANEIKLAEEFERKRLDRVKAEAENRAKRIAKAKLDFQKKTALIKQRKEESERRARQSDCASCLETGDKVDMCVLTCDHAYCQRCIRRAFMIASKSRKPFNCCQATPAASLADRWLSTSFVENYDAMLHELSTPNPRYCSSTPCHRFIPPQEIHGPIAWCKFCSTRTCVACGSAEHAGICEEDTEGLVVRALATSEGWKSCPQCSAIVQKNEGCLHMTCRCTSQWCWNCLRDWETCKSTCPRV